MTTSEASIVNSKVPKLPKEDIRTKSRERKQRSQQK